MMAHLTRLAAWSLIFVAIAFLTITPVRAGGDIGAPVGSPNKFVGWWELGGYYGTDDSSRGEIVLFTPLMQSATTLFFLDARGKFFEDDVQEANVALGYRQMMPSGWNLGLWGGWDIRETTNDNTFNQISFGIEALSERFDFRANGYVPLEDSETVTNVNTFQALLQGNNILVEGTNTVERELALYGFDAEAGILLFGGNRGGGGGLKGTPAAAKRHELRAYAGGFWFDNDDARDAIAGPKGRLEYRINDVIASLPGSRLTIESELSYDDVRDTKFEIGARLRIPFGGRGSDAAVRTASLSAQELRMTDGLERDTDIVTDERTDTTVTTEGAIDDATDVALNSVSFAKNANQLASAVNKGGNRLIIVQKGNKRIDVSATDGQALQSNQTVQGGASTILIRGRKTGEVVPFTAPGKRPTLFSDDNTVGTGVITLNNNTHVAGLNIRGGGTGGAIFNNHGVFALDNFDNIVIEQNSFKDIGGDAVRFGSNNSNVSITRNEITDITSFGVRFDDDNSNIWVTHNTISDNVFNDAIFFDDRNANVWVTHNTIRNIDRGGIEFESDSRNVIVSYNTIKNVGRDGVIFETGGSSNVRVTDNEISNVARIGVNFDNNNTDVVVAGNTILNALGGVDFGSNNTDVVVAGNTISNMTNDGVFFQGDNTDVVVAGNKITNVDDGIQFNSDNNDNVVIAGNVIKNTTTDALRFFGENDNLKIVDNTFTGIGQNVFEILGINNTLAAGSVDNVTTDAPGGSLCFTNAGGGQYTGTIEIDGINFTNGVGCN